MAANKRELVQLDHLAKITLETGIDVINRKSNRTGHVNLSCDAMSDPVY